MEVRIDSDTLARTANRQFALIRLQANEGQPQQVVCKSSFFTWAVHCLRYNFSKGYQGRVHTMRHEILQALSARLDEPSSPEDSSGRINNIVRNRRAFNQYTLKQLNASSQAVESTETPTVASSPEKVPADKAWLVGDTPNTSSQAVEPTETPTVDSSPKFSADKAWPANDTMYDTFWHKKGAELAKSGYRNLFRFQKNGSTQDCPNIKLSTTGRRHGSEIIFSEVTQRSECRSQGLSATFSLGIVPKTTAGCVISYLQLTTPISGGRHEKLYGWVSLLPRGSIGDKDAVQKDLKWFGMTGNPPERSTDAHLRVLGMRISEPVKRLVEKHFREGATEAEVITGLDKELERASDPEYIKGYQERGESLSTEEFEYLAQGVKDFATLYFADGS